MPFRARIPKVTRAWHVKDRVDEAWHSIKHRLVEGRLDWLPSRSRAAIERLKGGALRFKACEWLELSLGAHSGATQDAKIST